MRKPRAVQPGDWVAVVAPASPLAEATAQEEFQAGFNELTAQVLTVDSTVRRYETHFIKREVKFEPFVQLADNS
jgi:hypothetical protein